MEIEIGSDPKKAKAIGIVGVVLAVALALLDFVVLRGERVDSATAPYSGERPAVIVLCCSDPLIASVSGGNRVPARPRRAA